jgi:hypothetical protein
VSYRHLSGLLAHYGEEPIIYYVGPLAVDGLMVMATAALAAGKHARKAELVEPELVPVRSVQVGNVAPQPRVPAVGVPVPAPAFGRTDPVPVAAAPTLVMASATPAPNGQPHESPVSPAPTTDPQVNGSGPGKTSTIPEGLLARARKVVRFHHEDKGVQITVAELAQQMRVGVARARQLLAAVEAESNHQVVAASASPAG